LIVEPIQRILCPVDFSATSAHAFAFAERLALSLSSQLLLLHVSDREPAYTVAGQQSAADSELHRQLEGVRPRSLSVAVEHVLHSGVPGEVICWLAENRRCDLIVMGTHGRQGLMHLLLGSVAEYVMRNARCPVLTVRLLPEHEVPLKEPVVMPVPAPRFM
jgi:nucleotide-binding universal stress UspA family protein